MPKMISDREDFDLEDLADNRASTALFCAKKPEALHIGGWRLCKKGQVLRLIEAGETRYHVKYQVRRKNLWPAAQQAVQVEVWRQAGSGSLTHGLPKAVFFDYLLPRYGAVFCDYLHTDKRFWLDRLVEALELGHKIYYGDYGTRELIQVEDKNTLISGYQALCWGADVRHEYRRMAVIAHA